jgi:hypothetical protein
VELGGPDYSLTRQKVTDADGKEIAAASGKGAGYRYFGAAKNLPGVKELFEKEGPRKVRRTRFDMHKAVDADYYGFRDEDDGILVKVEAEAERKLQRRVRVGLHQFDNHVSELTKSHKGEAHEENANAHTHKAPTRTAPSTDEKQTNAFCASASLGKRQSVQQVYGSAADTRGMGHQRARQAGNAGTNT